MGRLPRMAAVTLPQGDDLQESHSRFDLPDALYVSDAALLQFVPDFSRAKKQREIAVERINLEVSDNGDNRISSIIHTLDVNHRRRTRSRSVVTGPFAKWTFGPRLYVGRRHL